MSLTPPLTTLALVSLLVAGSIWLTGRARRRKLARLRAERVTRHNERLFRALIRLAREAAEASERRVRKH